MGESRVMDLQSFDRLRWCKGELWSRVQRCSHRPGSKADDRVLMELQKAQVGIRASHLHSEQLLDILRLGDGVAALAGTELHQNELVVFTALELKGAPIGAVGEDGVSDICQRQRTSQAGRITRGQVTNELLEESLQVAQLPSCNLPLSGQGELFACCQPALEHLEIRVGIIAHEFLPGLFCGQPLREIPIPPLRGRTSSLARQLPQGR